MDIAHSLATAYGDFLLGNRHEERRRRISGRRFGDLGMVDRAFRTGFSHARNSSHGSRIIVCPRGTLSSAALTLIILELG